jgi:hypothetical protein
MSWPKSTLRQTPPQQSPGMKRYGATLSAPVSAGVLAEDGRGRSDRYTGVMNATGSSPAANVLFTGLDNDPPQRFFDGYNEPGNVIKTSRIGS